MNLDDVVPCPFCRGGFRSCKTCGGSGIKELKTSVSVVVSKVPVTWSGEQRPCKQCGVVIGIGNVKSTGHKVAFSFGTELVNHKLKCAKVPRWKRRT